MSNDADLQALYPFLHGQPQAPARLDEMLLHSVEEKARDSRNTNARFFGEHAPILVAAAKALANVYRGGGRMFSMGNGGSSCDALTSRWNSCIRSRPDVQRLRPLIWWRISR